MDDVSLAINVHYLGTKANTKRDLMTSDNGTILFHRWNTNSGLVKCLT